MSNKPTPSDTQSGIRAVALSLTVIFVFGMMLFGVQQCTARQLDKPMFPKTMEHRQNMQHMR